MKLKTQFLKLYHKFTISEEYEGNLEDEADKPSKFIEKLAEYKEKCICNDISKHQAGGFCRACHTDWL